MSFGYFFSVLLFTFVTTIHTYSQKELVEIETSETTVTKNQKSIINIKVVVKDKYHIQANKVNDEALIPTTLEIITVPELLIDSPIFPRFKLFRLQGTKDDLNVFDGKFVIRIPVEAAPGTAAGEYILKGSLRYQACDDRSCLFPRTINFVIGVVVK